MDSAEFPCPSDLVACSSPFHVDDAKLPAITRFRIVWGHDDECLLAAKERECRSHLVGLWLLGHDSLLLGIPFRPMRVGTRGAGTCRAHRARRLSGH